MYRSSLLALLLFSVAADAAEDSTCFGSQDKGTLKNGWQLPTNGKNYSAYSDIGVMTGRNYVHSKVYKVIVDTYAMLETQAPSKVYVYGESGYKEGGKFRPHKTHQNGLSVDFFGPCCRWRRPVRETANFYFEQIRLRHRVCWYRRIQWLLSIA